MIDRVCLRNAVWIVVLAAAFVALGIQAPVFPSRESADDVSAADSLEPASLASLATH